MDDNMQYLLLYLLGVLKSYMISPPRVQGPTDQIDEIAN